LEKFDVSSNKSTEISGCVDSAVIVNKFADHFSSSYCCIYSTGRADSLRKKYVRLRDGYCGNPIFDDNIFDTETICRIIFNVKPGKAPGTDSLPVEHLSYTHPALPVAVALSKLFKLIFACGYVPSGFQQSYIVPITKIRDCRTTAMSYDDLQGIAISPAISKALEPVA